MVQKKMNSNINLDFFEIFPGRVIERASYFMEKKRYTERYESMIVIEFREYGETGDYYGGLMLNYSESGFSFESETLELQSGTVLEFKIKHSSKETEKAR